MTGNEIGVEGVKALSEMMKKNTTLISLILSGLEKGKGKDKKQEMKDE